ncbi:MAG: ATP-binding cassette domain-containing protein, partial [Acidiferrobacterales bacterium]|nr:ATP-binding cassette domain-containing protein [Acidiferrobacterales bacterium]
NVRYFGAMHGMSGKSLEIRIDQLAELLDMQDFIERRAKGFSQGQKTKVALARALVHSPKNVLLDEPTNGLDIMATRGLRQVIHRLKDAGHCVVFSSHVMQEVSALCDDIVIIANGKIAVQGSVEELKQSMGKENLEDAFVKAVGTEEGLM